MQQVWLCYQLTVRFGPTCTSMKLCRWEVEMMCQGRQTIRVHTNAEPQQHTGFLMVFGRSKEPGVCSRVEPDAMCSIDLHFPSSSFPCRRV